MLRRRKRDDGNIERRSTRHRIKHVKQESFGFRTEDVEKSNGGNLGRGFTVFDSGTGPS
jgi:hypothetical protein